MKNSLSILIIIIFMPFLLMSQEVDTMETRAAQVSFIYPIGSSGLDAYKYNNHLSFNVLAGYNGGLEGFELAGIYNQIKYNMQGCQIAGIGNTVLGNAKGIQIGGIFNVDKYSMDGLQIAGISNYAKTSTALVQVAGIKNILRDTLGGLQIGGISNYSNGMKFGMQMAGIANVAKGDIYGSQISGISNVGSGKMYGFQLAGISNLSSSITYGSQIAGIANVSAGDMTGFQLGGIANLSAGRMTGVQIGGIINVANKLNGFQLGFINYADSLENGVPIGFISVVRKNGYHKLEISASETLYGNLAVKTGTKSFYNIFTVGARSKSDEIVWAYGYGIGSLIPLGEKLSINADLISYHVNDNVWWTNYLNSLVKLNLQTNYQLHKHISVFAGVSFNMHISDRYDSEDVERDHTTVPFKFAEIKAPETLIRMYPGINFGIRI